MKITIELSQEEYDPISRMARYAGTTDARIVEALIQGQAEAGYLDQEGDPNWTSIVEYLREMGEDSPILTKIERFLSAIEEYHREISQEDRKRKNFGQFESLAAFTAWEEGRFNRN